MGVKLDIIAFCKEGLGEVESEFAPFAQNGGLGRVHRLFPDGLQTIIETLNVALVA